MADFNDFYAGGAGVAPGRTTQAPQGMGSAGVSGGVSTSVSGKLSVANADVLGAIVLLGIALFLLHIE
jgi:hypothetical protein